VPGAILALTAAGLATAILGEGYTPFLLALVALATVVGAGLNILVGLTGQISIGHVGFYAIGLRRRRHDDERRQFLAGAAHGGPRRGRDRGAAGDPRAPRFRALSRDDDHRLRILRRACPHRVEHDDGRPERPDEYRAADVRLRPRRRARPRRTCRRHGRRRADVLSSPRTESARQSHGRRSRQRDRRPGHRLQSRRDQNNRIRAVRRRHRRRRRCVRIADGPSSRQARSRSRNRSCFCSR
jgi:hypothetical protein